MDPHATDMQELKGLVHNVSAATEALESSPAGSAAASARRALLREAKKLVASLEDPSTEVWPRAFQVNVGVAVDVASKMGVWEKLRGDGTITLAEIVETTGADEIMIVRIFRHLTAAGVLADAPGPGYAVTALGRPYLDPNHCSFNRFVLQQIIPPIMAMPDTLRARGYKAPTRASGTPFEWATGESLWAFLGARPERALDMANGMKSLHSGSLAGDAYPFADELAPQVGVRSGEEEHEHEQEQGQEEVAIVDVGGGQGHIMQEVRRLCPSLRGRLVVQDLPSALEGVVAPEGASSGGIEFMPYDMFTPQPVRDARAYYYRHILHDWNDEDASRLLRPVVDVLREGRRPGAKLLLVDLVLPDGGVSMQDAVRDFSMFPTGGLERTEAQWRALLARNGLRIKKIWRGSEPEACVECELGVD